MQKGYREGPEAEIYFSSMSTVAGDSAQSKTPRIVISQPVTGGESSAQGLGTGVTGRTPQQKVRGLEELKEEGESKILPQWDLKADNHPNPTEGGSGADGLQNLRSRGLAPDSPMLLQQGLLRGTKGFHLPRISGTSPSEPNDSIGGNEEEALLQTMLQSPSSVRKLHSSRPSLSPLARTPRQGQAVFAPMVHMGRQFQSHMEAVVLPAVTAPFWQTVSVAQWCFFNVVMILLNNKIFQGFGFAFPLSLTAIHFAISYIGAFVAIEILRLRPRASLPHAEQIRWMLPMAAITCFNVVLGNLTLRYIPLPLMQTLRAFAPALTVAIQRLVLKRSFSLWVYVSLFPVIGGAVLAYAPQVELPLGSVLAGFLSCVIGSTTVVFAEMMLQGKKNDIDSINALYFMVPYSALILTPPAAILEGLPLVSWYRKQLNPWPALTAILISGGVAFCLNFSLFYTIQSTSAVTFTVAGCAKVALTVVASWLLFQVPIQQISALGCSLTLLGVALYGWALFKAHQLKLQQRRAAAAAAGIGPEVGDQDEDEDKEGVESYLGAMM